MIYKDSNWINICKFNNTNEIIFTDDFLKATRSLGGKRRAFACQLITHWEGDDLKKLLDYFGPEEEENDLYSGVDGEPMDIDECLMDIWEYKEICGLEMEAEWYRDILRAKLLSIKIPKKLIDAYIKQMTLK